MNRRYQLIFIVRFSGYLIFLAGLFSLVFLFGPMLQAEAKYRLDKILGIKRFIVKSQKESTLSANIDSTGPNDFATVSSEGNNIMPVSTDYGIVIEKINANAKIIPAVNPANEQEYVRALGEGVAEALGSTSPGKPGNLYLFSHSTDAPWNIIRYNAIFYLLRELDKGDRVIIFYKNIRYDYIVYDKAIVQADDVSYLTNRYNQPVLTLQTCDPPGTLLNRLIIRAKLVNT